MRTLRFGRTGFDVPAISLGTWAYGGLNRAGERDVGWDGHSDDDARAALRACHQAGITHWDTADVYGDGRSEALIGSVWADVPREEIFLATKVGWDPGAFEHYYHPEQIRLRLERSLKNLGVEAIDLYYLHHCDFGPQDEHLEPALELVRRFRDEGKVRWIGLSDWDADRLMKHCAAVDPDVIQPYRNVLVAETWTQSGLQAWCAEHDVGVAFFSPLRHGLLLGKYEQPPEFPEGDFRRNVDAFRDGALLTKLREHRDQLEERFASLDQPLLSGLLGALLEDAPSGCALVGLRNPAQVEAAAAADAPLDGPDAAWVRALYAGLG